ALRPASVGWTATHFPNVGRRSTRPRASRASTIRAAADWVRPTRLPSSVTLMPGSAPSTTSAAAPLPLTPTAPAAPARARSVTASAVAPSRFAVLLVSCMTHAYRHKHGPCGRLAAVKLPVMPPVAPMLAKPIGDIPAGQMYEPKWDGFR